MLCHRLLPIPRINLCHRHPLVSFIVVLTVYCQAMFYNNVQCVDCVQNDNLN